MEMGGKKGVRLEVVMLKAATVFLASEDLHQHCKVPKLPC
jgi:hypothetical protein